MPDKHPSLVALGAAIRERRKAAGFAQEVFAVKAGIDRSYYGYIERGSHAISVLVLLQIAQALDVDACELLDQAKQAYPAAKAGKKAEPGDTDGTP